MTSRRRRRDRHARRADHPEPPPAARAPVKKADARRRADFQARMARMQRIRTVVGLLGFIPLAASLACGSGFDIIGVCAIPREVLLGLWAAIFGTFLGLTFRMWRERRAYQRTGAAT